MHIVTYRSQVWGPFLGKTNSWITWPEIYQWITSMWGDQYEIM